MSAKPYWVLALSLLGISFAGPLVRLSVADPITIAVWRLGLSLIIVAGFLFSSGEWRDWKRLATGELALAVFGGVCLALHFWAWNASIHLTTIAASVTLVNLQPMVVATISAIALKEVPTRRQIFGIAVAILGALVIAAPDLGGASTHRANAPLLGNLLAVSGAVTAAIYYTIGRRLRKSLGIWAYVAIVYATAFVGLVLIALLRGTTITPQPPREIAIFAGLALGPMLIGHTGMNWALKFLPAYVVNLTVLGEPVGATLLGALIPSIRQIPAPSTLLGGAIVLAGVVVAAGRPSRQSTLNA
ncbi:MAG TPA: DMT family transporter [Gemmatimonadaceae bacterium]